MTSEPVGRLWAHRSQAFAHLPYWKTVLAAGLPSSQALAFYSFQVIQSCCSFLQETILTYRSDWPGSNLWDKTTWNCSFYIPEMVKYWHFHMVYPKINMPLSLRKHLVNSLLQRWPCTAIEPQFREQQWYLILDQFDKASPLSSYSTCVLELAGKGRS